VTTSLIVFLGSQPVGGLSLIVRGGMTFRYSPDWLADPGAYPLSLSLPLQTAPFDDLATRPFFANLLPEAQIRQVIAAKLGISQGNDFALLEALGGECAGAVRLLPEGVEEVADYGDRPLGPAELDALIRELPRRPMLAGERGIRLSLAGVQNKLPVRFDAATQTVSLPGGQTPSLHILKPPLPHFPDSVANEAFCMTLARRLGLPVPEVAILRQEVDLYLVTRYDRETLPDGVVRRLHQEDFCQALGVLPDQKYEIEGGPGLADCFALIRRASQTPIADLKVLLEWTAFNLLIGNADGHGKNLSLLYRPTGVVLAPFYDLMSTAVYPELSDKMAMKIGGEARPDWIMPWHWDRLAEAIGVKPRMVRGTLQALATRIVPESTALAEAFAEPYGPSRAITDIVGIVASRARKTLDLLASAQP